MAESTASKVTFIQGLGGHVPSVFKRLGATRVDGFRSRDNNFYAQATNWSAWEMSINGKIELPFQDWFDDKNWKQRGETYTASETEVYALCGRFFFLTGQEIAQEDLLKVLSGASHLEWETFTRTDGTGKFITAPGAFVAPVENDEQSL